jgi:hypothetical protein
VALQGVLFFNKTPRSNPPFRRSLVPYPFVAINSTLLSHSSTARYVQARHNLHLENVDCPAIFRNDEKALEAAHAYMQDNSPNLTTDEEFIALTRDCARFRQDRGYFAEPLSTEEADFPLAFSILMYKDLHQIERLLRAIYQPQNFYCIHIDLKASKSTKNAAQSLTNCFPNVFVASQTASVFWGHISIMYAEMNCLRDLLNYDWKYFINLSGQMFPLRTNREIVKILSMYNGANDIHGSQKAALHHWKRIRFSWRLFEPLDSMLITYWRPKDPPPHNVTIFKGGNQVRKFFRSHTRNNFAFSRWPSLRSLPNTS